MTEPTFVIILTGASGQAFKAPRAVGPFHSFDAAQQVSNRLIEQWEAEDAPEIPSATVVHVEPPAPGKVVGEI